MKRPHAFRFVAQASKRCEEVYVLNRDSNSRISELVFKDSDQYKTWYTNEAGTKKISQLLTRDKNLYHLHVVFIIIIILVWKVVLISLLHRRRFIYIIIIVAPLICIGEQTYINRNASEQGLL